MSCFPSSSSSSTHSTRKTIRFTRILFVSHDMEQNEHISHSNFSSSITNKIICFSFFIIPKPKHMSFLSKKIPSHFHLNIPLNPKKHVSHSLYHTVTFNFLILLVQYPYLLLLQKLQTPQNKLLLSRSTSGSPVFFYKVE